MPLRIITRHGSPNYYLRGTVRGRSIDESTGTSDKEAAEQIRIKREAEELARSIHGDFVTRTFAEAALSYMENGGERVHVMPLINHFTTKKLAGIGQGEIDDAAKRLLPKASPSTRNRQVYTPMAAILHHAARKGWCPKPVIARPKLPEGRVRWITYEEADRLISAASPHMQPLIIFLLCTGARLSEALYLQWADVNLLRAHASFHGTKNGESRGIPLHPRAVAALSNLPWEKTGAVFRRPAGKIKKSGRIWLPYEERLGGGGQVKTGWAATCRRAGIKNFTPHDCRHTWATWHYAENRDFAALMQLGGWKSPAMVFRYAHINTDHLAMGIGKLWLEENKA